MRDGMVSPCRFFNPGPHPCVAIPATRFHAARRCARQPNGAAFAHLDGVLAALANLLIREFLEPPCLACGARLDRPLDGPVCAGCWRAVPMLTPPLCERCGDALAGWRVPAATCPRCRRQPPALDLTRSAGRYEGPLREIVQAFKYQHCRVLARPLAEMMRAAGPDVLRGAHAVVPVPLHARRRLARGFNQSADLARLLGVPVWPVLRRAGSGPPQAGLPAGRRHANVRHAYRTRPVVWIVEARVRPRVVSARALLDGRVVVLIDDVVTTGATLDACARALRAAGAREVRALTVARAVARRPARWPPPRRSSSARRR